MTDKDYHVFLSHSRNDPVATADLAGQLQRCGLEVFKDDESIQPGDEWLARLQSVLERCGAFVVLVGRDGVRRWIGAETQVALNRYFGPHDDAQRLPIFPILLDGIEPETLPAFLRLFQVTRWNGGEALPADLLANIRARNILRKVEPIPGCPFVGLAAYRPDQAHLFFGRQKETLDALACFETRGGRAPVRWLQIDGNSGSGKSSLMNAGLLPLIDQGWLWPRTGFAHWRRIGPMMPGTRPVAMLAEVLARAFQCEMADVHARLAEDGEPPLAFWLRSRKQDHTAFLLAIDQFEELFTTADAEERRSFDALLAGALVDVECRLYVVSTVRSDFLDRFANDLPHLVALKNGLGKAWTLAPIGTDALREVIDGPAGLARLDVGEVRELILADAQDEPGALPLVENALQWLWEKRDGHRLSGRLFREQGGLAGLLSRGADDLLGGLGPQRERALELLFALVNVDADARRHTRRRIALEEAVAVAGGGTRGRALVDRLTGQRRQDGAEQGPLRLLTITGEAGKDKGAPGDTRWVNLIHETLIRSKGLDAAGKPQPYWPTLWAYIEKNKARAARRERLQLMARDWNGRSGLDRYFSLAGWSSLFGFRGMTSPGSLEHRFLRWSRVNAAGWLGCALALFGFVAESVYWVSHNNFPLETASARMRRNLGFPDLPRLVQIPPGTFQMGERDCKEDDDRASCPARPVTLAGFDIGKHEVTFAQWAACLADGGCEAYMPSDEAWGRGDRPVINVQWSDAKLYTDWLSGQKRKECRLPTEAEWEYSARARTTTEYALPAPRGSDDITGLANCSDCGSESDAGRTAPVGKFPANRWGLYDVHGNVWEWIEDCWHDNYRRAPGNEQPWQEGDGGDCARVLRGGSWLLVQDFARSAFRGWFLPLYRNLGIGFRVVCSSPIVVP